MLLPIQESTFDKDNSRDVIEIEAGEIFYNAPRTANDRIKILDHYGNEKSYKNGFLSLWLDVTDAEPRGLLCANKDCPYEDRFWEYDLEGGHVVPEPPAEDEDGQLEPMHDGDRFCILPLCPKCNSSHNRKAMVLRYDVKSPVLTWRNA